MKQFFTIIFTTVLLIISCNGQPNTSTTIEVGIINPATGKTYLTFSEVDTDTSTSVLTEGMDYLNPDVSDLIVTLQNQSTVGDTLWGELQYDDQTYIRFIKCGLVQVDDFNQKYSAMKTSWWVDLDVIEPNQAGFIIRKKR
jgi:hypothetical protein